MKRISVLMVLALILISSNAASAFDPCQEEGKEKYNVTHTPRDDVIHGDNAVTVPDPVYVPITIDMAERFDLDIPEGTELESTIGMMEIYKDGRILYDGKDISGDIESECANVEFDTMLEKQTDNNE